MPIRPQLPMQLGIPHEALVDLGILLEARLEVPVLVGGQLAAVEMQFGGVQQLVAAETVHVAEELVQLALEYVAKFDVRLDEAAVDHQELEDDPRGAAPTRHAVLQEAVCDLEHGRDELTDRRLDIGSGAADAGSLKLGSVNLSERNRGILLSEPDPPGEDTDESQKQEECHDRKQACEDDPARPTSSS